MGLIAIVVPFQGENRGLDQVPRAALRFALG